MSGNTFYVGDCLAVLPTLPAGSVDLICADLPYGTTHCPWDGGWAAAPRDGSVLPLARLWAEWRRLLTPTGVVVCTAAQPFTSHLVLSAPDWFKYTLVWHKNRPANFASVRHQPLRVHEDLVVFAPGGANTNAKAPMCYQPQGVDWTPRPRRRTKDTKADGIHRYNSLGAGAYVSAGAHYPRSILAFDVPLAAERIHPTQKPVALLEYLIRTYAPPGGRVLDPCAGSGTAAVAAHAAGRAWTCIERDPAYAAAAVARCRAVAGLELIVVDNNGERC